MSHVQGKVTYKGKRMTPGRASRIEQLRPFINKANSKRMTIPEAANWMGWSVSSLRNWIRVLNVKWRTGPRRTVFKYDRSGWEEKIKKDLTAGRTHRAIASDLGVGHWNVTRFITEYGITK